MAIGSKKCLASDIKLAPPIQQAIILSEKQLEQKTWFTIQVIPQQTDIRIVNGSPVGKRATATRQPYTITRRYEDFSEFAQRLREAFPTTTRSLASRAGSRLLNNPSSALNDHTNTHHTSNSNNNDNSISIPKLNQGKRLMLNNKKRRSELDKFMQALFHLPPSISQSLVVLEFFGLQKEDTEHHIMQQVVETSRLVQRSQSSMTTTSQRKQSIQSKSKKYQKKQEKEEKTAALRKSVSHPDLLNDAPPLPSPLLLPSYSTIHPLDSPSFVEQQQQTTTTTGSTSPLWRRFRNRTRAPSTASQHVPLFPLSSPQPEPTVSTSSLTSLCSQAASMIMPWTSSGRTQQAPPPSMMHHQQYHPQQGRRGSPMMSPTSPSLMAQPRPSLSTPTGGRPTMEGTARRQPRKKLSAPCASTTSNTAYYPPPPVPRHHQPYHPLVNSSSIISSSSTSSSCYSHESQSTCATSIAPSPTTSPTLRLIKIKVIYDVDNIIVIQVPRSITLTDLRARIAQKFSDPSISLPKDFILLFNDTRSSASSNTSAASSFSVDSTSGTATLIAKEQDLTTAMGSTWVRHEKVTLRCVA
ncbi:hypothetical protein BDA99DRAFT_566218 [Phascolomyces articulosus]|uniref:PX domain-containing protein n=1 Tax=Phascolomyces articulosus TaxID=60185 RepID=A0AAD5JLY5_9FUNG|nr:hypothetical protein BDA99DRAFT_566218 [Phascolomyces articulosus]